MATYPFPVGDESIFSKRVEGNCGVVHCVIMWWRMNKERLVSLENVYVKEGQGPEYARSTTTTAMNETGRPTDELMAGSKQAGKSTSPPSPNITSLGLCRRTLSSTAPLGRAITLLPYAYPLISHTSHAQLFSSSTWNL